MKPDLARAVTILRRELLFQGLDTAQLVRVTNFFDMIELDDNVILFTQGARPDYFYIVMAGNVRLTRQERNRQVLLNIFGPGDFFGEQALLFNDPRTATAATQGPATLLRLSRERFRILLQEYPEIRKNIGATAESRRLLKRLRFKWLADDEVIYYITRRHWIRLLIRAVWPLIVLLIAGVVLGFSGLQAGIDFYKDPFGLGGLAVLFLGMLWFGWVYVDWNNDYYIVSNQRVIWQEKVVAMYDSRQEAPLNTVLTVNVSTDLLGRFLNYGDVDVRTYTGSIHMTQMNSPHIFASFVKGFSKRAQEISRQKREEEMSDALENALREREQEAQGEFPVATAPPSQYDQSVKRERKKTNAANWWRTFLKVRYEQDVSNGKMITYRKHWFILLKRTIVQVIALIASVLFVIAMSLTGVLTTPVILFFGLIWVMLIGWLLYEYMDWVNDIYCLTPDQIMDIERKPLGREQKLTASLGAPDFRVEHIRENIIGIVLNFGNVIINVGQSEFTFVGVYNPDQVHQDVSDYREAFLRRKQQQEEKRDRERMLKWLVTYHEQDGQLKQAENAAPSAEDQF
jgi:hypothetical protein